MGYKAFALSGRRGGVAIDPGCCPGLGASEMGLPDCFQDLKCGRIAAKKSIA